MYLRLLREGRMKENRKAVKMVLVGMTLPKYERQISLFRFVRGDDDADDDKIIMGKDNKRWRVEVTFGGFSGGSCLYWKMPPEFREGRELFRCLDHWFIALCEIIRFLHVLCSRWKGNPRCFAPWGTMKLMPHNHSQFHTSTTLLQCTNLFQTLSKAMP